MTEAPAFAPVKKNGLTPKSFRPNYAEIPHELIKPIGKLSEKRGKFIEKRVKGIIETQTDTVEQVIINKHNGSEDIKGHDLTLILKGGESVRTLYVQVKSRKEAITDYKQKIREKYIPDSNGKTEAEKDELVKRWLTMHGIILINGSERKSDEEILKDSFYPQLQRIQKDIIRRQNTNSSNQMNLFTENTRMQIFPSFVTGVQVPLIKHPLDNFKTQTEKIVKEDKAQIKDQLLTQIFPIDAANKQLTLRPFS
jgi:hypothetical protein